MRWHGSSLIKFPLVPHIPFKCHNRKSYFLQSQPIFGKCPETTLRIPGYSAASFHPVSIAYQWQPSYPTCIEGDRNADTPACGGAILRVSHASLLPGLGPLFRHGARRKSAGRVKVPHAFQAERIKRSNRYASIFLKISEDLEKRPGRLGVAHNTRPFIRHRRDTSIHTILNFFI